MTRDQSPPSRRRWREEHRPPVRHWRRGFFTEFRRNDPVYVIASWTLISAFGGVAGAAVGGRGRFRLAPDESAVMVAVAAAVASIALLVMAIRLRFSAEHPPLSTGGVVFGACVGGAAILLVVSRAEGVLSSAVWLMFTSLLSCGVMAAITLALGRRRASSRARTGRQRSHDGSR